MIVTLARIAAAMCYSMHVERIISSFNLTKNNFSKLDVKIAVEEWKARCQRKPHCDRDTTKFINYVAPFFGINTSQIDKLFALQ